MEIVGVSFKENGQVYYFSPGELKLRTGVTVIVNTEKGLQFGKVVLGNFDIDENKIKSQLKEIVRIASKKDYQQHKKNLYDAKEAIIECRKQIAKYKLNMYIVDASYTFDREQLIFRFFSDNRVDFRDLAKDLAGIYHTRIELRQIGVRDKAKEVGGYGTCGKPFCCSKFLHDFESVSISQAKNQNISLNPAKINGSCGRLKCCLRYEDDCYSECRKNLPKIGSKVVTKDGEGKVESINILEESYIVDVPNIGKIEIKK